jgi:hypothetical protein
MRFQMSNQIRCASLTSDDFLAPFKFAAIIVVIDIVKRRVRYVFSMFAHFTVHNELISDTICTKYLRYTCAQNNHVI